YFYSDTHVFICHSRNSKLESTYNFRIIWSFLDSVAMIIPSCKFIPSEARLQAITQELKWYSLLILTYYNADGIIVNQEYGIERVLLETSGPFGLHDITRETTDHIKAAYGI
ncbi:MAG: hypothetical protein EXX96DRAFT_634988, partial [Benjaminiella poitrasii]